jgi:hypothetical protein
MIDCIDSASRYSGNGMAALVYLQCMPAYFTFFTTWSIVLVWQVRRHRFNWSNNDFIHWQASRLHIDLMSGTAYQYPKSSICILVRRESVDASEVAPSCPIWFDLDHNTFLSARWNRNGKNRCLVNWIELYSVIELFQNISYISSSEMREIFRWKWGEIQECEQGNTTYTSKTTAKTNNALDWGRWGLLGGWDRRTWKRPWRWDYFCWIQESAFRATSMSCVSKCRSWSKGKIMLRLSAYIFYFFTFLIN